MAATSSQTLFTEARCFSCLGAVGGAQAMRIALLSQILEGLGTTMTAQELIDEGKCFLCLPGVSLADTVELALLDNISQGISGGGVTDSFFQEGNYAGGEPTWTPTGDVGFAIDTSTIPGTQWTYYSGAWH